MSFSPKAYRHMKQPLGFGQLEDADRIGVFGNELQGPFFIFYLKLRDDIIETASFRTYACPWAIASCSALVQLILHKDFHAASALSIVDLEQELGGVPREKRSCLVGALAALKTALLKQE